VLDAEILAEVYLAMTGGQVSLLVQQNNVQSNGDSVIKRISGNRAALTVIAPTDEELEAHEQRLAAIDKASGGKCLWLMVNG